MTQIINGNGPQIFTAGSSLVSAPAQTANGLELATMSNVKAQAQSQLVLSSVQPSTSGTFIDFTAIPAGVKRITLVLNLVSTNSTSHFLAQLGSGSVETSGYVGQANSGGALGTNSTAGFLVSTNQAAAASYTGLVTFVNISGNTWVEAGYVGASTLIGTTSSGSKTLSGTLDRVRLTTVIGTDVFDAGSVNILMEF
jgi:hypothetical protein